MNIDLNLDNYNLEDILNLFNLTKKFNKNDLKNARKIVLQVHDDNDVIDNEIFLFYYRAFCILKQVYEIKHNNKLNDKWYSIYITKPDKIKKPNIFYRFYLICRTNLFNKFI
jgi:hypothetical protein